MKWYENCIKFYVESTTAVMGYTDNKRFTALLKLLIHLNDGNHIKITESDDDGVIRSIDTKVVAITSLSESELYIIKDFYSLRDIMHSVLCSETRYKLISIDEKLDIDRSAGIIGLFRGNDYKCEVVPDVNPSSESIYKEECEKRITTIMTNLVIKSGFKNNFSTVFNELPTGLINKALELGCKIKIKPCGNASLETGLYRLTIILPKSKN